MSHPCFVQLTLQIHFWKFVDEGLWFIDRVVTPLLFLSEQFQSSKFTTGPSSTWLRSRGCRPWTWSAPWASASSWPCSSSSTRTSSSRWPTRRRTGKGRQSSRLVVFILYLYYKTVWRENTSEAETGEIKLFLWPIKKPPRTCGAPTTSRLESAEIFGHLLGREDEPNQKRDIWVKLSQSGSSEPEHDAELFTRRFPLSLHRTKSVPPSTINHQPSTIDHQSSTINHRPSTIDHQPSAINHQPSAISHQPSAINHQPSTINHQPSTINHQPSAISHQPSAISHRLSTSPTVKNL